MRPVSQQYLMVVEPSDKENDNDSQSAINIIAFLF